MMEQKQRRLDVTTDWFEQCVADHNFLDEVITGDESFFKQGPSDQQANKTYVKEGESNLKTPCRSRSNIKSMLILFFDRCGIVHHEFFRLQNNTRGQRDQWTMLSRYSWLHACITRVRSELFAANHWVLHHDNASLHTSHVGADWLVKNGTTQMLHSPYSSDIAMFDFWASQKSKKR